MSWGCLSKWGLGILLQSWFTVGVWIWMQNLMEACMCSCTHMDIRLTILLFCCLCSLACLCCTRCCLRARGCCPPMYPWSPTLGTLRHGRTALYGTLSLCGHKGELWRHKSSWESVCVCALFKWRHMNAGPFQDMKIAGPYAYDLLNTVYLYAPFRALNVTFQQMCCKQKCVRYLWLSPVRGSTPQDGHHLPGGPAAVPGFPGGAPLPPVQPADALLPLPGQAHRPPAQEQHRVSLQPIATPAVLLKAKHNAQFQ